ncbi:unnamed protein product [Scytosiphon promiscuus]
MTWRRMIAARTVRRWKPKLEEIFREANQFGVAVAGGVERVAMETQLVHQTGNWIIQTICSNAFNTGKRTAIMAQAAKSLPDLVGYIARCYDEIPTTRYTRWILENGGRSSARAVCNKEMAWDHLCSP